MRRFFAILAFLLLVLALLEPVLPPPVVPAWPGRVTTSQAAQSAMSRPAEALSAGRVRSLPPAAGTLCREALLAQPTSLIPLLPGGDNTVTRLLFRGLARLDDAGSPGPDLAVGWVENGGTGWTVRLKPGLKWHDGEPVTAHDVVFTFAAAASPGLQALEGEGAAFEIVRRRARLWASRRVEAVDDLTVRITLDQPDASLPYDLTLPLLPAHILAGLPDPRDWARSAFAAAPVGTGFFRWGGGSDGGANSGDAAPSAGTAGEISLSAFSQEGLWPALAGYQFIPVSGSDGALQAMQAGKLDGVAFDASAGLDGSAAASFAVDLLARARERQLQSEALAGTEALLLLWSPLSDAALRQAVAAALTRRDAEAMRLAATMLASLGWAPGPDGWRQRDGQTLQLLLDFSVGPTAGLGRRKEAIATLVRPLRDLGIQVLASREPTGPEGRQGVPLAARIVFWEGGKDPDLANLVAVIPDVPEDLLRLAAEPRRLMDNTARQARLDVLAARLRSEALVTELARSRRILIARRGLLQEAGSWFRAVEAVAPVGSSQAAAGGGLAGVNAR